MEEPHALAGGSTRSDQANKTSYGFSLSGLPAAGLPFFPTSGPVTCRDGRGRNLLSMARSQWLAASFSVYPASVRPMDEPPAPQKIDRKSTRLNSSHLGISYAV